VIFGDLAELDVVYPLFSVPGEHAGQQICELGTQWHLFAVSHRRGLFHIGTDLFLAEGFTLVEGPHEADVQDGHSQTKYLVAHNSISLSLIALPAQSYHLLEACCSLRRPVVICQNIIGFFTIF